VNCRPVTSNFQHCFAVSAAGCRFLADTASHQARRKATASGPQLGRRLEETIGESTAQ
jgi:hypothetical protein